uniref:Uncharacterized protein n=1 Tax=Tanacetum cinerariifolium TaxID=118510 RepID=A0A699UPI5_TANCI|nr:hypothetical protein [Tanacetum cinerariifolium]
MAKEGVKVEEIFEMLWWWFQKCTKPSVSPNEVCWWKERFTLHVIGAFGCGASSRAAIGVVTCKVGGDSSGVVGGMVM